MNDTKAKLERAFEALQGCGLLARTNFLCCKNCAGSEMTNMAVEQVKKGKTVTGCVFYTRQGEDDLLRDGGVHLSYGPLESKELGQIGESSEQVGQMVAEECRLVGLEVDWDGTGLQCIYIGTTPV